MTNTEMIDKIVQKSGITREQAEDALAKNNWDLLDAMIYVERNYSQQASSSSSSYSTYNGGYNQNPQSFRFDEKQKTQSGSFDGEGVLKKLWEFLVRNSLVISRNGRDIAALPVIVWAVLLLSSFSSILVIMLLTMFFDVKYYFRGQQLGTDAVNGVMDSIFNLVQKVKKSILG